MDNSLKERTADRKERDKKDRGLKQAYIYKIKRNRQNTEKRPYTRIKYEDQTTKENIIIDKNDKNIIFGKKSDFYSIIGQIGRK